MLKNKDFERMSFSIVVNKLEGSSNKYVVIKPYINIQSRDFDWISNFKDELSLDHTKIYELASKNRSTIFKLAVQNFDDIQKILDKANKIGFLTDDKTKTFKNFRKVFELLNDDKHVFSEYHPKIKKYIEYKNIINVNRYNTKSVDQQLFEIKEFLES